MLSQIMEICTNYTNRVKILNAWLPYPLNELMKKPDHGCDDAVTYSSMRSFNLNQNHPEVLNTESSLFAGAQYF